MEDRVGTFAVGKEFDALLVDTSLGGTAGPFDVFEGEDDLQRFEKFINLGDDRNLLEVYVQVRVCTCAGAGAGGHVCVCACGCAHARARVCTCAAGADSCGWGNEDECACCAGSGRAVALGTEQ